LALISSWAYLSFSLYLSSLSALTLASKARFYTASSSSLFLVA
jgi:hypothetical protein